VVERDSKRRVAILNKDDARVTVQLPSRVGEQAMRLSGPALDSKQGTAFDKVRVARSQNVVVEGHTGMIDEV
jgi:hypothetical protein